MSSALLEFLQRNGRTSHRSRNVSLNVAENTVKTCCLLHNLSNGWDSYWYEDNLSVVILLSSQIAYGQLGVKFRKKSSVLINSIPIRFYTATFISNGWQAATQSILCEHTHLKRWSAVADVTSCVTPDGT
jgi:hypothetical protein